MVGGPKSENPNNYTTFVGCQPCAGNQRSVTTQPVSAPERERIAGDIQHQQPAHQPFWRLFSIAWDQRPVLLILPPSDRRLERIGRGASTPLPSHPGFGSHISH